MNKTGRAGGSGRCKATPCWQARAGSEWGVVGDAMEGEGDRPARRTFRGQQQLQLLPGHHDEDAGAAKQLQEGEEHDGAQARPARRRLAQLGVCAGRVGGQQLEGAADELPAQRKHGQQQGLRQGISGGRGRQPSSPRGEQLWFGGQDHVQSPYLCRKCGPAAPHHRVRHPQQPCPHENVQDVERRLERRRAFLCAAAGVIAITTAASTAGTSDSGQQVLRARRRRRHHRSQDTRTRDGDIVMSADTQHSQFEGSPTWFLQATAERGHHGRQKQRLPPWAPGH